MEPKTLAGRIAASLDKHKAEDIRILHVTALTSLADYFIVASGTSTTQVKALSDYVDEELSKEGEEPLRVEGYAASNWILMDYGTVVVHIFQSETRTFYDLERLWKDASVMDTEAFISGQE